MEINNISSNPISELNVQTGLDQSNNNITVNKTQKISDSLSNSYSVNPNISTRRSELSDNLSQHISAISSNQVELSNFNNQNNILDTISQTSIIALENPQTVTPELEQSLNELMGKYNTIVSHNQTNDNENSDSTAYFDGMLGAKPLRLQDMINTSEELKESTKNDIKVVENKIETIKTTALNTIGEEISKNANLQPNKQIDFGKTTSDFSASNINALIGSVAVTQANAIPINSQRLLA